MNSEEKTKKLWKQAEVLRGDGISYHEYLIELTYLVFLKMAHEQNINEIPTKYRWDKLVEKDGVALKNFYSELLNDLGKEKIEITLEEYNELKNSKEFEVDIVENELNEQYYLINHHSLLRKIFKNASSNIQEPKNLKIIINALETLDWYSEDRENLGDMYEGLLEKNAEDTKSGAGQYFTPRAVIDAIVEVMKPQLGMKILDPAAGTFGFLVAANQYIRENNDMNALSNEQYVFQTENAYAGMELVSNTHKLALMNSLLHGISPKDLRLGNSLSENGLWMKNFDMVLTNPPFGIANEQATRDDVTYNTSNKQLNFLQVIYNSLKKDGKATAAVIIPDGVLTGISNQGPSIRKDLLNKTNLHTILRLPTGIFYKPGVKTYVLFFTRGITDFNNTKEVWVYDLRSLKHFTPKKNKIRTEDFNEFIALYNSGNIENRKETWSNDNNKGRWRKYDIKDILDSPDVSLDLHWIQEEKELLDPKLLLDDYLLKQEKLDREIKSMIEEIQLILSKEYIDE